MSEHIECRGGPADGQRVRDRGLFWRVVGTVDPEHPATVIPGSAGTYTLRQGEYRWEPDPT